MMIIQPRLLRLRDAPAYLGMNINYFNAEVRPHLTSIKIGKQGIAFDRLDLDTFAERYKNSNKIVNKWEGSSKSTLDFMSNPADDYQRTVECCESIQGD